MTKKPGSKILGWGILCVWLGMAPVSMAAPIDLNPDGVQSSPTLQKWLKQVPDVRSQIRNEPAFKTRLRLGYVNFDEAVGIQLGLEDLQLGKTPMTLSTDYRIGGRDRSWGVDVHYQLRPLGSVVNFAPTIGYRRLTIADQATTGLNLGLRTRLNLSRGGGADITIDQSWIAPGSNQEAGLTRFSFGYAITKNVRIATDWQRQNTDRNRENQWGIAIEWMR